ncbi:histidine kinase [Streptomyces triticagri]|uniref:histidine kinase n=1 Tax=Streptomyces triticagri TaxID=2293568 RepID=A0A372M733_9ACTN|nr:nitrate- and nitrite sensing domain-containing protein [Streptomyces triticagri]RFU86752.1 histidine kinase [Streptomyces triticagri]
MRAPVQKKRLRGKGGKDGAGSARPEGEAATGGRTVRVRSRLVIAVAVVAATVAGAGAPAIIGASSRLNESQRLVTLAELTEEAVTLAHSLADERDEVTSYIAAGRPQGKGLAESRSGRVDRQIAEIRSAAPDGLRADLDTIATVRRGSLTGKHDALEAHTSYTDAIAELHGLAAELADQVPPRAGGGRQALADLDRAVEQGAAARGLLLAALATPRPEPATTIDPVTGLPVTSTADTPDDRRRDALSAAAQQARVREQAALADFRQDAPRADRERLESTLSGPEVATAEKYLARLTDQPTLSDAELGFRRTKVDAALSARVEQMRGVENRLAADRTEALAQLRDDDVTALELRIALVGVLLLVAVGVSMGVSRTLTRPLAVLRLGSARLAEAGAQPAPGGKDVGSGKDGGSGDEAAVVEPIRFTGRNDEFAAVVRSVNALHEHSIRMRERIGVLEGDRKHLIGQREKLADEREELRAQLAEAGVELERASRSINSTFVSLALRTLGLVERQLSVIEQLEEREQDPERLATLFKLDHFATVMRRHSENLLVLAGAEHKHTHPGPVPLIDVARAAVSEIERYERVRIATLPPHAHIAGFVADDLSHLLAELLENATTFSPPDAQVEISGWLLESGEVMLSVQDEGIGLPDDRIEALNSRLADFDPAATYDAEGGEGLGLGLYVVARLAARHGTRVQLRDQKQGGVAAVVVLPRPILAAAPAGGLPPRHAPVAGGAPAVHLPGSEAEANSNVLTGRSTADGADATSADEADDLQAADEDPLIAAAEAAFRSAEAETGADPGGAEPGEDDLPAAGDTTDPTNDSTTDPTVDEVPASELTLQLMAPFEANSPEPAAASWATADEGVRATEGEAVRDGADDEGDDVRDAGAEGACDEAADPDDAADADDLAPAPELRAQGPTTSTLGTADLARRQADEPAPAAQPTDTSEPVPNEPVPNEPVPNEPVPNEPVPPQSAVAGDDDEHSAEPPRSPRIPAARFGEEADSASAAPRLTAKGLPKRTPKVSAPAPAPVRPGGGSVDAEALRRRLGGFRRGAMAGRRDVEAELAADAPAADTAVQTAADDTPAPDATDTPSAIPDGPDGDRTSDQTDSAAPQPTTAAAPTAPTDGDPVEEARS